MRKPALMLGARRSGSLTGISALTQATQRSTLNGVEKSDALRASPHWLRHTFGTRAVEPGVTKSVLMAQFGHADERPTSRYSRAQREQMNAEIGKPFG
jgi:site-specific recombinase XerD